MHITKFSRISAAALVIGSMAIAPALAAGNGGGNAGGNADGNSASHSSSDSAGGKSGQSGMSDMKNGAASMQKSSSSSTKSSGTKASDTHKSAAADLGKLNGFLHASPEALQKAAPNSSIGMVTHGYANALTSYLSGGQNAKTAADVYAALQAASNKPLTVTTITAVDAKLAKADPALATAISSYPGGAKALAQEIAAAGPTQKSTGMTSPSPKKTVQ